MLRRVMKLSTPVANGNTSENNVSVKLALSMVAIALLTVIAGK